MAYYKITYESDTVEGLKAIQGGSASQGTGADKSLKSDSPAPPPPVQQDSEKTDSSSDRMQPPPTGSDDSMRPDGTPMQSPPPATASMQAMDVDVIPQPPLKK